jgi:hypothetical protein
MIKEAAVGMTVTAMICFGTVNAQQPAPPVGYFDIPSGYDFPADKAMLEGYRSTANLSKQRLHVWNVFAGMTQATPDGKFAIWETWYSEDETFQSGPSAQAAPGNRRVTRRFRSPNQFRVPAGQVAAQAAGTAVLSFVLYNNAAYSHVRNTQLYLRTSLDALRTNGIADPKVPGNRDVPAFPANAAALKTIWWPVAKTGITPLPIWDPAANPARPGGNPFTDWARAVAIDTTRPIVPAGEKKTVSFGGRTFQNSNVVGIGSFHYVVLDEQGVTSAMSHPEIVGVVKMALGRALQPGDYAVFLGTHLTTKEIDDWVWATFWWHDQPDVGPFAADRPATVKGPWRNYLMSSSFDVNLPREADNSPHITFNPWLEARFSDGLMSNCMNCHSRSSYPSPGFLPVRRGDPDLKADAAFKKGQLRTDLLWSIPDMAE